MKLRNFKLHLNVGWKLKHCSCVLYNNNLYSHIPVRTITRELLKLKCLLAEKTISSKWRRSNCRCCWSLISPSHSLSQQPFIFAAIRQGGMKPVFSPPFLWWEESIRIKSEGLTLSDKRGSSIGDISGNICELGRGVRWAKIGRRGVWPWVWEAQCPC